jgi:hypothetical protein
MYLRHTTICKDGKSHTYWHLVRSVRYGSKVRQETVAMLGELDADGRLKAKSLAREICGQTCEADLFHDELPTESIPVRLDQIHLERHRRFGDVWLAWQLWRTLGLDTFLDSLISEGREEISWSLMAAVLVITRLCEPSSELHWAQMGYRVTALEDLLGIPADKINDDRLYRALDRLLPHKQALGVHLKNRLGTLFGIEYDLLFTM